MSKNFNTPQQFFATLLIFISLSSFPSLLTRCSSGNKGIPKVRKIIQELPTVVNKVERSVITWKNIKKIKDLSSDLQKLNFCKKGKVCEEIAKIMINSGLKSNSRNIMFDKIKKGETLLTFKIEEKKINALYKDAVNIIEDIDAKFIFIKKPKLTRDPLRKIVVITSDDQSQVVLKKSNKSRYEIGKFQNYMADAVILKSKYIKKLKRQAFQEEIVRHQTPWKIDDELRKIDDELRKLPEDTAAIYKP